MSHVGRNHRGDSNVQNHHTNIQKRASSEKAAGLTPSHRLCTNVSNDVRQDVFTLFFPLQALLSFDLDTQTHTSTQKKAQALRFTSLHGGVASR